jgi:hypothetical protein
MDISSKSALTPDAKESAALSDWVYAFIFFGASIMLVVGTMHMLQGMVAVLDDSFYIVKDEYPFEIDVTVWGWLHLLSGALMIIAAIGLVSGSAISRILAIVLASLSAVWSFYSIPYYPIWSIIILVLDAGMIWIVARHGRQLAEEAGMYSDEQDPI